MGDGTRWSPAPALGWAARAGITAAAGLRAVAAALTCLMPSVPFEGSTRSYEIQVGVLHALLVGCTLVAADAPDRPATHASVAMMPGVSVTGIAASASLAGFIAALAVRVARGSVRHAAPA